MLRPRHCGRKRCLFTNFPINEDERTHRWTIRTSGLRLSNTHTLLQQVRQGCYRQEQSRLRTHEKSSDWRVQEVAVARISWILNGAISKQLGLVHQVQVSSAEGETFEESWNELNNRTDRFWLGKRRQTPAQVWPFLKEERCSRL